MIYTRTYGPQVVRGLWKVCDGCSKRLWFGSLFWIRIDGAPRNRWHLCPKCILDHLPKCILDHLPKALPHCTGNQPLCPHPLWERRNAECPWHYTMGMHHADGSRCLCYADRTTKLFADTQPCPDMQFPSSK